MLSRRSSYTVLGVVLPLLVCINIFYYQQHSSPHHRVHINATTQVPRSDRQPPSANPTHVKMTHRFRYILNPSETCTNHPDTQLVMCVPISRHNFAGRRTISDTWGSYAYDGANKALLFFFIGTGNATEPPEVQARIVNESREFKDIVQADFLDSYRNLSLKSVAMLEWVTSFCPETRFVLKADDDVYVNVPRLVKLLETKNVKGKFILGHAISGARPLRHKTSKWYTSRREFSGPTYPKYVSGTGYAMTALAAKRLFEMAQQTPLFWLEDIYVTGLCRTKAGVAVIHTEEMTYLKPKPTGCVFRSIVSGHRYTDAQIRHIHKELYDPRLVCK